MSRIGKKPIPLPKGVTYAVEGNTVTVKGPKGTVDNPHAGRRFARAEGWQLLTVVREDDSKAAVHGLVRALVNNSVEGVTNGWTKELDIVGIGYRAELKGKGIVVFTLGYSHPIEYPLPTRHRGHDRSQADAPDASAASIARRSDSLPRKCARCVRPIRTRTRACVTATSG